MFHAVQHDECDDDDVAKWYDYPAGKAPILVNQSTYETICESKKWFRFKREREREWEIGREREMLNRKRRKLNQKKNKNTVKNY